MRLVSVNMATMSSIDGERRRLELVEMAGTGGGVAIERAAAQFAVSAMTIRRDLEALEAEGLVRRVRGGAVAVPVPRSYSERLATRASAKRSIAQKAMRFLPERGAIAMDASTTVGAIASLLGATADLTVCTNSLQTFDVLAKFQGVEALLTGGSFEPVTGSLVGPIANSGARATHTEVFFTSAAGVSPELGTSEASLAEAEVKRVFAERTQRTVLCLDSSKLGQSSLGSALVFENIDALITELDPTDSRLDAYRSVVTLA